MEGHECKGRVRAGHRSQDNLHISTVDLVPGAEAYRAHRLERSGYSACALWEVLGSATCKFGNPRKLVGSLVPVQTQGPTAMDGSQ